MNRADSIQFISEADSRQTCPEIMRAIAEIAGNYDQAVLMWGAPHTDDVQRIAEIVRRDTGEGPSEFAWGAAGFSWAEQEGHHDA